MKIVALDLGKFKSVGCAYEVQTGEYRFETVKTHGTALMEYLEAQKADRVVIEVSSSAGWMSELVSVLGMTLQVANPSHEGWRWRHVKRKTDRTDALKLARLSAMNQLPLVQVPCREVRQWRSLIHYRQQLVARRTAIKNSIRSILDRESLKMPSGKKAWTQKGIEWLEAMAKEWKDTSKGSLWCGQLGEELNQLAHVEQSIGMVEIRLDRLAAADDRVALVRSVPGVGARLSEMIVAVLDDPHRFKTGKQVAAYVGLVPRQWQSGTMNRQGRITGQGHKQLRSLLVEVSWLGQRHNEWMRDVFQRVCRGSKARRKIAIVAVARRLLIRCWAMLRDGRRWSPPCDMTAEAA